MMKIIEKTEHLLKLKNGLSLFGLVFPALWLIGFTGIPLSMILIPMSSSGVERLSCKKIEPKIASCEMSKSSFMGLVKGELQSIPQVKEARVDKIDTTDSDGNSTFKHNVFLVTNQGSVYLPSQTVDDANSFNQYIQNSVEKLVIEKDNRVLDFGGILIFGSFVVIGFAAVYSMIDDLFSVDTYIFDKNTSILTLKKRGIRTNKVVEKSLSKISEVELKTVQYKTEHMDSYIHEYEVRLLMNEGDILCLSRSSNREEQQKMADLIRGYLDERSPKSITNDK
ncbi:hypothetical protein [Microcoleus sp. bin38.metabat.b11b12b14.051]|uniref:hypothetical protein n=1 Tax=Microcoleus sp. bin38.metabat.b11b12b14.051 TaxID=2742709 RepID=UPI0025DD6E25|nr:hypothetical protein [Microcoleus sp. bin38.metabat.b11b12b14.051]